MTQNQSNHEAERDYLHLLSQVRIAVRQVANRCVLTPDEPTFQLDGVLIGVRHIHHSGLNWLQIDFTMLDFEVADAATLARLLVMNHELAATSPLVGYFALDAAGGRLQFIQRTTLADLPVWALEKYFTDTVGRLNQMFVSVVLA
ncbi:MAG: hypothetical protein QE278_10670 [Limnobacter sp.]|nr:hypothetical protein [Limnobacter sp.]